MASLTSHLGAGLPTALLASKLANAGGATGPGLLVLGEDLAVVASTPMAQQWLDEVKTQRTPLGDLPRRVCGRRPVAQY